MKSENSETIELESLEGALSYSKTMIQNTLSTQERTKGRKFETCLGR